MVIASRGVHPSAVHVEGPVGRDGAPATRRHPSGQAGECKTRAQESLLAAAGKLVSSHAFGPSSSNALSTRFSVGHDREVSAAEGVFCLSFGPSSRSESGRRRERPPRPRSVESPPAPTTASGARASRRVGRTREGVECHTPQRKVSPLGDRIADDGDRIFEGRECAKSFR
jgi:hypothetical protein